MAEETKNPVQPANNSTSTQASQAPKPKSPWRTLGCLVLILIVIFAIVFLFLWFWMPKDSNDKLISIVQKNNPAPATTSTASYGGNWTLNMTQNSTTTGGGTDITTTGTGSINFSMPASEGGKVTASGDWSSQGAGTVAMSNETSELSGKINITAEIKNGKLHFTASYTGASCVATVTTPIGGTVRTQCDPTTPSEHTIDIDIQDGATASSTIGHQYGGIYNYSGTENWTLIKK